MKQFLQLFFPIGVLIAVLVTSASSQTPPSGGGAIEIPAVVALDDSFPVLNSVMLDPSNHPVSYNVGGGVAVFNDLSLDLSGSSRRAIWGLGGNIDMNLVGRASVLRRSSGLYKDVPLEVSVSIHPQPASGDEQVFDVEMLSLSISGGGLPSGTMIRESPTLASLGQIKLRESPSRPSLVRGFFDIFTELSIDGGATWAPADGAVRVEIKILPKVSSPPPSSGPVTAGRYIGDINQDGIPDIVVAFPEPSPDLAIDTTRTYNLQAGFDYFISAGDAMVANPGQPVIRIKHTFDDGSTRFYDTEMLQMDISGGALPSGMMLRESPTLPSKGKTSIRAMAGGHDEVSSFFDIFTELSTNGGQSWAPQPPASLELRDTIPGQVPAMATTDNSLPVLGSVMLDPSNHPVTYSVGSFFDVFTEVTLDVSGSPRVKPPLPGESVTQPMTGVARFHLSLDGGQTYQVHTCPIDATMRTTSSSRSADTRKFDTEMLSLSLSGGSLPSGVMIRESPTLPSIGKTSLRESPTRPTMVSSFFDIFTELSVDGGLTWIAADGSVRLECKQPIPAISVGIGAICVKGSFFGTSSGDPDFDLLRLTHNTVPAPPLPPVGSSTTFSLGDATSRIVIGGLERAPSDVTCTIRCTGRADIGAVRSFDTEMLSLSLSGGTLPGGVMVRESPSKASLGRTTVRSIPGGLYELSSFFDVFTELSIDGGQSWTPQLPTTLAYSDTLPSVSTTGEECVSTATFPNDLYPPDPGMLAQRAGAAPVVFADGTIMFATQMRGTSPPSSLPALGTTQLMDVDEDCDMKISLGAVSSPTDMHATGHMRVTMLHSSDNGSIRTFDTEMLQLDLLGNAGGQVVMLRESPTKQSVGKHLIASNGNGYRISSFFDVFLELSTDGGGTWSESAQSTQIEYVLLIALRPFSTHNFPAPGSLHIEPECSSISFDNGAQMRVGSFFDIFPDAALPPPGGSSTNAATGHAHMQLSLDGGNSFFDVFTEVSMSTHVTATNTTPTDQFFDTEMLSLSLTGHGGGGGGGSIMLRESPSRPSLGQVRLRESPTRMSSFFDVFTELSVDGGQTWSPAQSSMRIELDTLKPGTITGIKWHDANGNGIFDGGETGLANWKIMLADTLGNILDSVLTDVAGNYSFTNVASGTYRVREELQPGWIQTGGSPAYGFWMVPGDTISGNDFGNFGVQNLTGVKFNDHNGNGVRDPEDEGMRDWEVCLFPKNIPTPGAGVSSGSATFSMRLNGLPPGVPLTGNLGVLAGVAIPKFISITKEAQRGSARADVGRAGHFENGDIPTEMLALDLQGLGTAGGVVYELDIRESPSRTTRKGWDGTIKGLRESPTLPPIRSSFFDVFLELEIKPRDASSGASVGKSMYAEIVLEGDLDGDGVPDALAPGTVYHLRPTGLYDASNDVQIGTLDAMDITIGQPASQVNPICVKTDSAGRYSFSPMLPGVWNIMERRQPCWEQTTANPGPIEVTSTGGVSCTSPDNGSGTADLPASCAITGGMMMMTNGLDPGSSTGSDASLHTFTAITRSAGGSLGGEHDQFGATLTLDMTGTGDYSTYHRVIPIPMSVQMDHAPRTPGNPVQSFNSDMYGMQGQITGDPDFDLLRITGGTSFGMPSPGHTTLTRSASSWTVASFFDITYRVDFVGHPGGPFGGRSGSTTGTIRMSQGGAGSSIQIDFGNHQDGGTICVAKYEDINHNQLRDIGEPPMAGVPMVLLNMGTGQSVTQQTGPTGLTYFNDLPNGDYQLTENVPAGYTISVPKAGKSFFTVLTCDTQKTTWLDAAAFTDTSFRTATYEEWATAVDVKSARKPIKCKPDKVEFKLNLIVPPPNPATDFYTNLELKFSMPVDSLRIWNGKDKTVPYCLTSATSDAKHTTWNLDLRCNDAVTGAQPLIQFDGYGLKGKPISVAYTWTNNNPKGKLAFKLPSKPRTIGDTIKVNQPKLPMPNLVNVLEELQEQGAFPIVIGGAVGDTHSVYLKNYSDLLKSMAKPVKGGPFILHDTTKLGGCFDSLGGKLVKKQVKGILPDKIQHRLFAEALTLKLNILASMHRKFPAGLDTLIYDYHKTQSGPFDGKSVAEILRQTEAFLSCKPNPKPGATAADYFFVLRRINGAFSGPIDTIRWSCLKLEMTGTHTLKQVPFLRANPGSFAQFVPAPEKSGMNVQPANYELMQNYPNPFNPTTTIQFELAEASDVTLKIYNTLGQEVAVLLNHELMEDGSQQIEFNANNLPSGVYFYSIMAQGLGDPDEGIQGQQYVSVKKMILVK